MSSWLNDPKLGSTTWGHRGASGTMGIELRRGIASGDIADRETAERFLEQHGVERAKLETWLDGSGIEPGELLLEDRLAEDDGGTDCDACGLPVCACEGRR